MTIVSLEAQNVKRLKAIRIEPTGNVIVLGGKNGAGKSSVLDCIAYALAGGKSLPPVPIRTGEMRAQIILDLGDLRVERRFTPRGSELIVRGTDGREYTNPQKLLDDLCSRLAFDPLEFSRLEPAKQAETLKKLVGLDFYQLDQERRERYEARTDINRGLKQAEARLKAAPEQPDAPAAEVSLADALGKLSAAESANLGKTQAIAAANAIAREGAEVRRLRDEVQAEILRLTQRETELTAAFEGKRVQYASAKLKADEMTEQDTGELRKWVDDLEATNRRVRAQQEHLKLKRDCDDLRAQSEGLTARLEAIDGEKAEAIRTARYPVPGLSVNDSGVTLNALPLEQASSAEQLRASVAIGLALNPRLHVLLVRDGSLLDEESLALVAMMAADAGAQIWIERVGKGQEVTVLIEDGEAWDPENGEKLDGSKARSKIEAMLAGQEEGTFAEAMGLGAPAPAESLAVGLLAPLAGIAAGLVDDPFRDE